MKLNIRTEDIERIFRDADIEGLIGNGAPDNEYDSEAQQKLEAIARLAPDDATEDRIAGIIRLVWSKSFNRGDDEISLRMPAFKQVAHKIHMRITGE